MDVLQFGWKPIETAPRNLHGYPLLVSDGAYAISARWIDEFGWCQPGLDEALDPQPTHWIAVEDLMRAVPWPAAPIDSESLALFQRGIDELPRQSRARLTLRVRPEVKESLDRAARNNGRSRSVEAEIRLEHSFFEECLIRADY